MPRQQPEKPRTDKSTPVPENPWPHNDPDRDAYRKSHVGTDNHRPNEKPPR